MLQINLSQSGDSARNEVIHRGVLQPHFDRFSSWFKLPIQASIAHNKNLRVQDLLSGLFRALALALLIHYFSALYHAWNVLTLRNNRTRTTERLRRAA